MDKIRRLSKVLTERRNSNEFLDYDEFEVIFKYIGGHIVVVISSFRLGFPFCYQFSVIYLVLWRLHAERIVYFEFHLLLVSCRKLEW